MAIGALMSAARKRRDTQQAKTASAEATGDEAAIHLVDASPYIFRAFFSIKGLSAPDGSEVNAVYGFAHFLLRLVETAGLADAETAHVAICFDRSLTTSFRNEIYPPYKAQRDLPPPALEAQLSRSEAMAKALGFATFIDSRYEADDLIAGILARLPAEDESVIVTSDKDLAQLVSERVTLWDFARDQRYGAQEVVAKFGVRPEQIVDYLGLAGDSVDNIPGVKGVGAKTAAALLAHFADLESLYDDLDSVAGLPIRGAKSLGGKLADQRQSAFLSRQLATVAVDRPAAVRLEDLRWQGADADLLEPLAAELGFDRLASRVPRWRD